MSLLAWMHGRNNSRLVGGTLLAVFVSLELMGVSRGGDIDATINRCSLLIRREYKEENDSG